AGLRAASSVLISISVNGVPHEAPDPTRNLLSYLRYDLGLTGTKYSCGDGVCGACTCRVDGEPQLSCTATVGAVLGGSITTIEGLAREGALVQGIPRRR